MQFILTLLAFICVLFAAVTFLAAFSIVAACTVGGIGFVGLLAWIALS
jgi:hypothetical protein